MEEDEIIDVVEETPDEEEDEEEVPEESAPATVAKRAAPVELTAEEQHRLSEILLYHYFNRMDGKVFGTAGFWNAIRDVCETFGIDNIAVSKGFRILLVDVNRPTDLETWYLLDKTQHSVRQIRNISGIYWQKQKKLLEEVEHMGVPSIRARVTDPAMRKNIKDFVFAIYGICGIFQFTDAKTLQKALC